MRGRTEVTEKPLVSIGLPVYNGERSIRKALESLLAQTYDQLEIIVCDNVSTDGTPAVVTEYAARDSRVKYIRNERNLGHRGSHGNFRRTLSHARGKYFMWAAADDYRPPTGVECCVQALERNPRAVMAHGPVDVTFRNRPGAVVPVANAMDLTSDDVSERVRTFVSSVAHNAILYGLYRTDALAKTVFGAHFGHDYLAVLQTCVLGPIEYVPTTLLQYRQRGDALDAVMYPVQPVTLKDLLTYQGVRRYKCWQTLVMGCRYLATLDGPTRTDRLMGASVFVGAFARRYPVHLTRELLFLLLAPLAWLCAPMVPAGVRLKNTLKASGLRVG
jgi:glycosyltransferase involved in cell wall biosynthesis